MKKLEKFRSRYLYSFADQVCDFIANDNEESDDILFDFFADVRKTAKPHKITLLHDLILNVLQFGFVYSTRKCAEWEVGTYEKILRESEFEIPIWLNENDVRDHIDELDILLDRALVRIVPSVFFVLYSDRAFLSEFQALVARYVETLKLTDHQDVLRKDGILRRPNYLPTWLKEAVFHRDKGRCQLCWKDLTGLLTPVHDLQLDHIIPLALSGSNDPTNFQLACQECNLEKGGHAVSTPPRFTPYW